MERNYFFKTLGNALVTSAIAISAGLLTGGFIGSVLAELLFGVSNTNAYNMLMTCGACGGAALTLALVWYFYFKRSNLPDTWCERLIPIASSYIYYLGLWVLTLGLANYSYDGESWRAFFYLTIPYIVLTFLLMWGGDYTLFPVMQVAAVLIMIGIMALVSHTKKLRPTFGKGFA